MNLQQTIDLAEMNRNSFNTLQRRTGLDFMGMSLRSDTKQDRYRIAHAFALATVRQLQGAGMEAQQAVDMVSAEFGFIEAFTHKADQVEPAAAWLSVVFVDDGAVEIATGYLADAGRTMAGNPEGVVSVNLATLWAKMAKRFAEMDPIGPAVRADMPHAS